jgi:ferredoxin-type protein NapH
MNIIILNQKVKPILRSLLMVFLMAVPTFFTTGIIYELFHPEKDFVRIGVWLLFLLFFFLINYTGKIDHFRAALFILIAVCFPVDFIPRLFELRGHIMTATFEDALHGQVPFCHIVIPQTLVSVITKKEVLFPGSMDQVGRFIYSIGFMIVTWIGVSLLIGRGWCSWACFFGGWEDGFSRIRKKPFIKKMPKILFYLPFAILLVAVLLSVVFVTPAYCFWLCPFKAVSEFVEVSSPLLIIQTIVFVLLFIGLVIVLPILTRKRTQCSFLCPFGAMQSIVDKINPFYVRIDKNKCTKCGQCIKECPVMAIDNESLKKGKVKMTCIKCGRCIDQCPQKAISFHIKGAPVSLRHTGFAQAVFQYLCFFVITTIGSHFIITAINRLGLLISTGSIVK